MSSSEEVIEIVRERVKGRVWTIYVCAELDGQDCGSGTHPNILRHKCAAVRRFHETQGKAPGPQLVEVDVTWIDGKLCRYVVCGSRDWPVLQFVTEQMVRLIPHGALVITGGARGVDNYANSEAARLGYPTKEMRADWDRYGKRAGFVRNLQMLDERPCAVLAFQFKGSRGTGHTISEARKRGITVYHFTEDDLRHAE